MVCSIGISKGFNYSWVTTALSVMTLLRMSTATRIQPCMVYADENGNIYDHPDLLMLCRRGAELTLPRPDELIPLPEESEFFLLPGRGALGFDPESGQVEELDELAVAGLPLSRKCSATAVA